MTYYTIIFTKSSRGRAFAHKEKDIGIAVGSDIGF